MNKIDRLIAIDVMGFGEEILSCFYDYTPSTKIDLAWEVIKKLAEKGCQIRLSNKAQSNEYWWCYIALDDGDIGSKDVAAQGTTAPEAICLAALKLYGIEI